MNSILEKVKDLKNMALLKNQLISTAESCTGGLVAKYITDIQGSSSFYESSVVTYSNSSKISLLNVSSKTLSDYGAGKKRLLEGLNANHVIPEFYYPYDPAFPEYGKPQKAELVCCIDVLEHIEPELIDNVIKELSLLVTDWGFFTIHQGPAAKFLSDGRNAHLIQESTSWWLKKLIKYFDIFKLQKNTIGGTGFFVIVKPLIS